MEGIDLRTTATEWKTLDNFPGNLRGKVLREDSREGGGKSLLVHLLPGETIAPHSHTSTVQHFVVNGSYEAGGKKYRDFDFRLIPAHTESEPIKTKTGATIFIAFDPVS